VKAALAVLGYTETLWQADKEPEANDEDFDDLTADQQSAAVFLGYDKAKWDAEE